MGYLRKSKLEDFKFVVENMREMDRLETYYQTDMTPEDALSVTFLGSQINMTIASDDDEPIGWSLSSATVILVLLPKKV